MVASLVQSYRILSLPLTWNDDFEWGLAIVARLGKYDTNGLFN